ncbi:hypothetical protein ACS0TY_015750 [Phlomoides rotata]
MAVQLKHHHISTLTHRKHHQPPFSAARSGSVRVHAVLGGRAQELIQSGAITPISPKDAASAMESQGYTLLDIRPEWEREKARVSGSLHVPLFMEDKDNSPITLLKKWVHFGYIGLWTGQLFTMINPTFVEQVEKSVPDKESKLLVACGEGLRDTSYTKQLYFEEESSCEPGFKEFFVKNYPQPQCNEYMIITLWSHVHEDP